MFRTHFPSTQTSVFLSVGSVRVFLFLSRMGMLTNAWCSMDPPLEALPSPFGIRPKGSIPADVAPVSVSDRLILSWPREVSESPVTTKRFERVEAMATTKTTWTRMAHLQAMQKARVSRPRAAKVVVRSHKAAGEGMRRDEPMVAPAWGMVLAVTVAWNTAQDAMAIGITDQESYLSSLGSVSVESIQSQDKKKKVAKPEKPKPETKAKAKAIVADEPATTKKGKVSYAKPEAKVEVAVPETQKESKKETKVQTKPKPKPAAAPTKAEAEAPTKAKAEAAPKAKVEVPSVTAPALPSLEIPKSSSSKATKALAIAGAEILAALAAAAAIKGLLA